MSDDMLTRGLRVLEALAAHPDGAGVTQIARDVGLPTSTTHRLLAVLSTERFVTYEPRSRTYEIGLRVLELARGFGRARRGYLLTLEVMQRLADRTDLPVLAAVRDDDSVLIVLSVEGRQHIQVRGNIGTRNPWYATSIGKALVAYTPPDEQARLLSGDLTAVTDRTITDADVLRRELASIRRQGWAEVDGENEVGVRALAVPVLDTAGEHPLFAISIAATTVLTSRDELHSHLKLLRETAAEVGLRLAAANATLVPPGSAL